MGGLDDYAVPLMDMFFFAYDKAEEGYVDLDEEQQADLDDLYEQLDNARVQMLGENYTRMLINLNLPEEGRRPLLSSRPSTGRRSGTTTRTASIWWGIPPATMTCPSPLPGITS